MAAPLLPAFGEKDFFDTAFNYNRDQIVNWLRACAKGEKGGARTKLEEVQKLLKQIGPRIEVLSLPEGAQFKNPSLSPNSHFPRKTDPNWVSKRVTPREAKFILLPLPSTYQGALTAPITVDWWNPYDLLGFFLGVLGPADIGATKRNYFLPLCAVYAQWCSRLAGHTDDDWGWGKPWVGAGVWPFMFNITWRPDGNPVTAQYFFLGSSTAGDEWQDWVVGQWRPRVQRHRFNTLHGGLKLKPFQQDSFDKKNSPVQAKSRGAGQPYGNCAETYPFIFSIRGTVDANKNLQGLALQKEFMRANPKAYDEATAWAYLYGPCANCREIIKFAKANPKNFAIDFEKAKLLQGTASQAVTSMEESTSTPTAAAATAAPEGWSDKPADLNVSLYWGTNGAGTIVCNINRYVFPQQDFKVNTLSPTPHSSPAVMIHRIPATYPNIRQAAKKVGLNSPQGLFIITRDRGGDQYIFKDGTTGKIYVWSMLTGEIFEFTKPTDLDSIVAQLNLPVGKATMETTQLDDIESG
ncbi:hypothetical protein GGR51DRAFT_572175 [Nemania sp. FL0031]|nr:hypothetical protein GGR51DRAFT_572175 [Nemania sp. FL0031]